jgi:kynurenine formamidase
LTGYVNPALFALLREGRVYDLSSGWWPGMPLSPDHPPFNVVTYRSPRGERLQRDLPFLADNEVNFGFVSELLMCTVHSGTHIDAVGHVSCGLDSAIHGGYPSDEALGDFGLLRGDATELAPIVARGVLLDVARALEVDALAAHQAFGRPELELTVARQDVEVSPGDVVLLRTGTMRYWPDAVALAGCAGAGLALEGAEWLVDHAPLAIGADNVALEVSPSGIPGDPQPVHRFVIQERGIPIIEWVNLEQLAKEEVYEFLFLCVPLPIRGATGSLVRPLALV